jgi:PQQ enzyme repeat
MKSLLHRAPALPFVIGLLGACSDPATTPVDASSPTDVQTPSDAATDTPSPTDRPATDGSTSDGGTGSSASVLSFGGDPGRTAAYRNETRLTPDALRGGSFGVDSAFSPEFDGALYGQPLYMSGLTVMGARHDVLFVATQGNSVYAVDAVTGAELWHTMLGPTVARSALSCGNIPTIGVTSTPVIDAATRTLYAVSFTNDGGIRFKINALDITTGEQRMGYPAAITAMANGSGIDPRVTGQRGALGFRDGRVYVPFGGLYGDCGIYHGWVVGIDAASPATQTAFATPGRGSGLWAPAGFSMDGMGRIFAATGNSTPLGSSTAGSLGEFVLRLSTGAGGPTFVADSPADAFSPSDARNLDLQDLDIGSVAPVLLPGATPRILQAGKAGTAYLLDPNNLGGSTPVSSARVCTGGVFGAMAAWSNGTETYAFVPARGTRSGGCGGSNGVVALRLAADGSGFTTAWCSGSVAASNPPAVSSNGNNDGVLWVTGASTGLGTTPVLRAYEVSTGMEVYANTEPPPAGVRQWVPPIVADGRVYVTGATSISMYRLR